MSLTLVMCLLILVAHFVGDFLAQTDWMALNKSRYWWPLLAHICVYSVFLVPFGPVWAITNGLLHLIVDAISSRVTRRLREKEKWHWFFVVIGADQMVHYCCLFSTYALFQSLGLLW